MNKTIIAFLLSLICEWAYAEAPNVANTFNVDTSFTDLLMNKRVDIQGDLTQQYENLLGRINKEDPSYARYLESQNNLSTEQKLQRMRSWAAQKAFEYYEQLFRDEMNAKSGQTGRQVRHALYNNNPKYEEYFTWLDRGDLEKSECRKDGWNVCKYPKGFEEYEIVTRTVKNGDDIYYKISFDKDMPDKNTTYWCDVELEMRPYNHISNDGKSVTNHEEYNASFEVSCTLYEYDDYYVWKNQEVDDILAGKYEIVEWKDYGGPFGKVGITRTGERDWKSNYIPTFQVTGYDLSASRSLETTETK